MSAAAAETVSSEALAFVQLCQFAVYRFLNSDQGSKLSTLWACFHNVERWSNEADRITASSAVLRLALGLHEDQSRSAEQVLVGPTTETHRPAGEPLRVLLRRFHEPGITLAKVANELGMSYCYCSRVIKTDTGEGYPTHLNGLRMFDAAILLRATRLRIKEVSARVGYARTAELDRHCWRWFGMSPTQFRHAIPFGLSKDAAEEAIHEFIGTHSDSRPAEIADSVRADLGLVVSVCERASSSPTCLGISVSKASATPLRHGLRS
jgi:AraC-like DNA-binding protein